MTADPPRPGATARSPFARASRWLGERAQAASALTLWLIAAVLPVGVASRVGAGIMAWFGPLQRKHRQVLRNMAVAHPHLGGAALERLARDAWRNFGSVLFEYPHLGRIYRERVTFDIAPETEALLASGTPVAVLTAHVGNWELLAHLFAERSSHMTVVYGPQGNELLDRIIQRFRGSSDSTWITKHDALRRISSRSLAGGSVGFLPDVRVDSGVMLPLFGVDAPTTISPARVALRLGYPAVPARVKRLPGARFELQVLAPLVIDPDLSAKDAALAMTRDYNRILESWIRERPGEWHCTKRRWPKRAPAG